MTRIAILFACCERVLTEGSASERWLRFRRLPIHFVWRLLTLWELLTNVEGLTNGTREPSETTPARQCLEQGGAFHTVSIC